MIYELDEFLSKDECNDFIEKINNNKTIVPFTNSGLFKNNKWRDLELATSFYNRIKLDENIIRPNDVIMSGMYNVGDSFSLHTDTGLYYSSTEETRWTLLIYLNDDYTGGETVFYNDDWTHKKTVIPKTGKAILFDIDLWHKGNVLLSGTKYWIGCEIIGKCVPHRGLTNVKLK